MDGFDRETGEVMERPQLPAMAESRPQQNLIFASPECGEIFGALCEAQGAMEAPKRTKTAKVKGRTRTGTEYDYSYAYAPLDEIIRVIQAPLSAAGLMHRQFLAVRDGRHVMRTIIGHKQTGQWMATDYPIFWDESRGMQGFASGVTYARRYGLMLALGIAAEDDDDANVADGNVATVQDRRQAASRGRTATKTPEATVVPPPPTNGTTAPAEGLDGAATMTPEQRGESYDDAVAQVANAKQAIDACQTPEEVDTLFKSKQWDGCKNIIRKGRPKQADAMIQQLIERGRDRMLALADGPMTAGEMG